MGTAITEPTLLADGLPRMFFHDFIARQLRQPTGLFGRWAMPIFFRRANASLYAHALEALGVGAEDQVLEIGFGSGESLRHLSRLAARGKVTGIDISAEMVALVQGRLAPQIASGLISAQLGDVTRTDFADAAFTRIITANTIYFWPDPTAAMAEIRRITAPGGRVVIAFRSEEKMRAHTLPGFRLWTPQAVAELMRNAGFESVTMRHFDQDKPLDSVLAIGTAPS